MSIVDRLTIREMRQEDVAAVTRIYNAGIAGRAATFEERTRTETEVAGWLERPEPAIVAELGGTVVGFARVKPFSDRDVFAGIGDHGVYVAPGHQRQGIGRALLDGLAGAAAAGGLWKLTSRIFANNSGSIAAHEAAGFRVVGIQHRHARLDGVWRDVVLVERVIGEAAGEDAVSIGTGGGHESDLETPAARFFARLAVPVVLAPMTGGPSTPELCAAVSAAGGLGFLGGGNIDRDALRGAIDATKALTGRPFGVNLFVPGPKTPDGAAVSEYWARLERRAHEFGTGLGEPSWNDDNYEDKVALLCGDPPAAVSFAFGCPSAEVVSALQEAGAVVFVTVATPGDAALAAERGADALVVQGAEAGGHRSTFDDRAERVDRGLLALLQLVRAEVGADLPLIAAGGIATGAGVAAVLAGGARAAQVGTSFLRCPEAGTSDLHRRWLAERGHATRPTRAFTGRLARALINSFVREHDEAAPSAYPEIHQMTRPLRVAARDAGDGDWTHLWAGEAYELAEELPAAEVVAKLSREARAALAGAALRGA